ncbi:hypothetical protein ACWGVR_06455 [Streptomyces xanthophaeus]
MDILEPAEGSPTALAAKTLSPAGHSISYTYSGARQLTGIADQSRQLVRIEHSNDQVRIIHPSNSTVPATYTLNLKDRWLTEVAVPKGPSWLFTYQDGQLATARSSAATTTEYKVGKHPLTILPNGAVLTDGQPPLDTDIAEEYPYTGTDQGSFNAGDSK